MNVPTVFQVKYNAYMHTALYTRLVFECLENIIDVVIVSSSFDSRALYL